VYAATRLSLDRGDLRQALQSVDSRLQLLSPSAGYWYWKLATLKAEILMQQRHTQECLAMLQSEPPANLKDTDVDVRRKMTLGIAYAYSLNFEQAERFLSEAESLAAAKHPELVGDVLLREGTLALTRGQSEIAGSKYRAALEKARVQNNPFLQASSLGNLALLATRQEHYDESLEWNLEALEQAKAIDARSYVAIILGNIGWSYLEMGEYEQALDLLGQARAAAEQAGMVRLQIDVLLNTGIAHYQQREYELSKQAYQQALALATSTTDRAAMADCFESLAQLGLATGELDFAQQNQNKVTEFTRQYPDRSLELYSFLVTGRLQQTRKQYRESESSFHAVIKDSSATAAQRWQAQDRLAETYIMEGRDADAEREFRQALTTIDKARSASGAEELRLAFLSKSISVYDDYMEFLLGHARVKEALEIADLSRAVTLEEGLTGRSSSSAQSRRKIEPQRIAQQLKATLLCYWMGESHSYLWAVTPRSTEVFRLPRAAEVQQEVKTYRQAITEMHDVLGEQSQEGKRLYTILVEPAKKLIVKDSPVILLPSESLYGLNFETLIVSNPTPHYWMEDVTLSTGSSLKLLSVSTNSSAPTQKSILLVGNPNSPNREYPPLAEAPDEMRRIAGHFPASQCKVLQGAGATAVAYLQSNPERFAYLHFVTHGTASHTRPLESAVILSKEGDSFKLYARDIVAHRLKAQLVTISACNGAGTRAYAGEGLVGLSWAFLRAGARNVVASLWDVSDASSTPELMDAMYRSLDRGENPATALRQAKLFILKSNDGTVFRKPFYWAAFQLYVGS
jgi:CHAT domain-containing protein